jgi:hypothetical protein
MANVTAFGVLAGFDAEEAIDLADAGLDAIQDHEATRAYLARCVKPVAVPIATVEVVKVRGEWQVKAFDARGVRLPSADYFTGDRQDAYDTADLMVSASCQAIH